MNLDGGVRERERLQKVAVISCINGFRTLGNGWYCNPELHEDVRKQQVSQVGDVHLRQVIELLQEWKYGTTHERSRVLNFCQRK
jgi:hypothetical protein